MTKIKFTTEDVEKIIDFVRNHEILYNKRHKDFRDREKKQRLWLEIAEQLDITAEAVKGKWTTMRDYFMRTIDKRGNGSVAPLTKRDESLKFLLDTSPPKKPSMKANTRPSKQHTDSAKVRNTVLTTKNERTPAAPPVESPRRAGKRTRTVAEIQQTTTPELISKKCATLVEPLPPKPSKTPKLAQNNSLQIFFESIASTMRTFPPLSIAKVKLQISQLVGNEEIALAERNANTEVFYLTKNQIVYESEKEAEVDYDSNNESVV
uniref:MADF domain-containing protein n=1 Tax=Bactrocera dorsalis TaxID=27457 RepID=A0A034VDA4_BACDO